MLVLTALRQFNHAAHMTLEEPLAMVERLAPNRAYMTHVAHEMGRHADIDRLLPDHVHFAHDGLVVRSRDRKRRPTGTLFACTVEENYGRGKGESMDYKSIAEGIAQILEDVGILAIVAVIASVGYDVLHHPARWAPHVCLTAVSPPYRPFHPARAGDPRRRRHHPHRRDNADLPEPRRARSPHPDPDLLSIEIEMELEGRWPWQREPPAAMDARNEG